MYISAIDTLQAIVDGDTIVPGMNFVLPTGIGRTLYYNPSTHAFTPDYADLSTKIKVYPHNYSSGTGRFLVPDAGQYQWYLNAPGVASAAILTSQGGSTVVEKFRSIFRATTVTLTGQTFPALELIGCPADANDLNDVTLYFVGKFGGIEVTSHGEFPVRESVGDIFEVIINSVSGDGSGHTIDGDTVIDNDAEWLQLTASLANRGVSVLEGTYTWWRVTASGMQQVTHQAGITEISNNGKTLKLYDGAVEGTEEYFAKVVYNNNNYWGGIQVSDTHDPYFINIGRSQASNLVKDGDTVTYTPTVLKREGNVVQTGWTFTFTLRDNDKNVIRSATAATFSVTHAELLQYGELTTHITANKNT